MRELKFKLFDTVKKEMVNYLNCSICIDGSGIQAFNEDGVITGTESNKHLIPLQYTGLKDKNDKEVYEGDVVKIFDYKYIVKFGICPDDKITCFYLERVIKDISTYRLKKRLGKRY